MYYRTTIGFWWSTTRSDATHAYELRTDTSIVYPHGGDARGGGFALRCVLGLPTTNTDNVAAKANQLANFPLNFLRTGNYNYEDGKMYNRRETSYSWSGARVSATQVNALRTHTTVVDPQGILLRGNGFAGRCVMV